MQILLKLVRLWVVNVTLIAVLLPVQTSDDVRNTVHAAPGDTCQLKWSVVPSPNQGTNQNQLNGLAVVSPNDIWAVGFARVDSDSSKTLIEHWDGQAWSIVPSPNRDAGFNHLQSVSAVSANDVWAAGFTQLQSGFLPLVEHWDGTQWSIIPLPDVGDADLSGITAVSVNDVWAIGGFGETIGHPLVFHWDGVTWARVPVLEPNPPYGGLNDLKVLGPDNIWAVGVQKTDPYGVWYTLVLHFDGTIWEVVPSPSIVPGSYDNQIFSVATVSTDDVWAVGFAHKIYGGHNFYGLLEHWDGSAWNIMPDSMPTDGFGSLSGIAASSANDVWIVGYYRSSAFDEHWNGTQWENLSPNNGSGLLADVAIAAANDVWAVGWQYSEQNQMQTLVLHGGPTCVKQVRCSRAPRQLLPRAGARLDQMNIRLDWRDRPCAAYYEIVIRQDSPRGKLYERVSLVRVSEYMTHKQFTAGKTYVWKVRACNDLGCGEWSEWRAFKIKSALE